MRGARSVPRSTCYVLRNTWCILREINNPQIVQIYTDYYAISFMRNCFIALNRLDMTFRKSNRLKLRLCSFEPFVLDDYIESIAMKIDEKRNRKNPIN